MKTTSRHPLSEKEITVWIMIAIIFVLTVAAGYLLWQKVEIF